MWAEGTTGPRYGQGAWGIPGAGREHEGGGAQVGTGDPGVGKRHGVTQVREEGTGTQVWAEGNGDPSLGRVHGGLRCGQRAGGTQGEGRGYGGTHTWAGATGAAGGVDRWWR